MLNQSPETANAVHWRQVICFVRAAIFGCTLAVSLIVAGGPQRVFAAQQSSLGRFAEEQLRKEQSRTKPVSPGEAATKQKTGRLARGRAPLVGGGKRPAAGRKRAAPATEYETMLSCGASGVEIFVDNKRAGTTDGKGELVVRLKKGRHLIFLRGRGVTPQRRAIEVRPQQTAFSFALRSPSAAPIVAESATWQLPLPGDPAPVDRETVKLLARQENEKTAAVLIDKILFAPSSGGDAAPSLAEWSEVIKKTVGDDEASSTDPHLIFARGYVAYLQHDYADAITIYNSMLAQPRPSPLAFYGLGLVYMATNQRAEALRAYGRSVQQDAKFTPGYRAMGDLMRGQNRNEQALGHYRNAMARGDRTTMTRLKVVRILVERRRWSEASEELMQIPEDQRTAEIYLLIGDCQANTKLWDHALSSYGRAIELDRASAAAHYKLGEVLMQRREYREAKNALERSLVLDQTGASINRLTARRMADEAERRALDRTSTAIGR